MALQIVLQRTSHILALGNDAHTGRHVFAYLRHEQRIVGTAQDDGIDLRVLGHQLVDALLDKIVGPGRVSFVILYQRYPERTGHTTDRDIGVQLLDFKIVALALDGTLGCQHTDVARCGETADDLGRGTDYAQHATLRIPLGQVFLLNAAQSLG